MTKQVAPTLKEIASMELPELYEQLGRMRYAIGQIRIQLADPPADDADWRRNASVALAHFQKAEQALPEFIKKRLCEKASLEVIVSMTDVVNCADAFLRGTCTRQELQEQVDSYFGLLTEEEEV